MGISTETEEDGIYSSSIYGQLDKQPLYTIPPVPTDIQNSPFYTGEISRDNAEQMLRSKPDGMSRLLGHHCTKV